MKKKHHLPLRSAAPPLMMRATITTPVASSLLMVAPWSTGRKTVLVGRSKGLAPSSLLQSHHHNPPEAPCSSPAWQSSLTLPPVPPQSRPAVAATRGQSSSEPRCRAPRERPDQTEKIQLKIRCQTESLAGKMAASQIPVLHHFLPCTLRCGEVRRCSSSFSSLLIGPLCSSSATCRSQHTTLCVHVCS